jgi:hypothetical protein
LRRAEALALTAAAAGIGLALLLAACTEEAAPTPPERKPERQAPATPPAAAASSNPDRPRSAAETGDAADVLRRYYALIGERRYSQAHKLREPNGADAGAFAAHFERFASHGVTVGTPSEPVEAGGWLYVEVPVHTYGTMRDGTPFGSAGTVTLRRREPGGEWRIFTKG